MSPIIIEMKIEGTKMSCKYDNIVFSQEAPTKKDIKRNLYIYKSSLKATIAKHLTNFSGNVNDTEGIKKMREVYSKINVIVS